MVSGWIKYETTNPNRRGGGWGRVDLGNFFDSHANDNNKIDNNINKNKNG